MTADDKIPENNDLDPWCIGCYNFKDQPLYYGSGPKKGFITSCVHQDICRGCLEQYRKYVHYMMKFAKESSEGESK